MSIEGDNVNAGNPNNSSVMFHTDEDIQQTQDSIKSFINPQTQPVIIQQNKNNKSKWLSDDMV